MSSNGNRKRVVVLGSTGSIGTQTLDVASQHADRLQIIALAAGTRTKELLEQARRFDVHHIAVGVPEALNQEMTQGFIEQSQSAFSSETDFEDAYKPQVGQGSFGTGSDAVVELCHLPEADIVVNALVGAQGLRASYETLKAGKILALANKESLVVGGDLIMPLSTHDTLLPIDSEHGAIYQCLLGENRKEVSKLWVTASGGPFRGKTRKDLENVTPAQALAHPTWNMGKKISIDSSTLMNKGLEVIEAHHLFAIDYDFIEVVVQPLERNSFDGGI